jgi:hypothetical protein
MSVEHTSVHQRRDRREAGQHTLPQFGIFAQGTHAHRFLEFDLKPGVKPDQALAAFRDLRAPDVSAGGVNLVLALGAGLTRAVAPSNAPDDLGPFEPVEGRDRRRYDLLVGRMFGTASDRVRDRLTDFSRPVAGADYFAPSQDALNDLAGPE